MGRIGFDFEQRQKAWAIGVTDRFTRWRVEFLRHFIARVTAGQRGALRAKRKKSLCG